MILLLRIFIAIFSLVLIAKLLSFFRKMVPNVKDIEKLCQDLKKEAEKETKDPNEVAKLVEKKLEGFLSYYLNVNIWLPVFFTVIPLIIVFLYVVSRLIQMVIIGNAKYVIIDAWSPFGLPIGFLAITLGGLVIEVFIGKSYLLRRLGKNSERYYQLATRLGHFAYKIGILFIFLSGIVSLVFTSFVIYHYAKVTDDGIYLIPWFSYQEIFYSWEDIDYLAIKRGNILKNNEDLILYEPHVVVFMKDGTEWHTNSYRVEANGKKTEMIYFILFKSRVRIEEKVWNSITGEYVPYSDELLKKYNVIYDR